MSTMSDAKARSLAVAALRLFSTRGYAGTSMADIAREAGVARATLYVRFSDKSTLFGWLTQAVADDAMAAAAAASAADATLGERMLGAILAKDLPLYHLINASPHGAQLMAVDADLTMAKSRSIDAGLAAILESLAQDGPDFDLSLFDGAGGFGRFLATTSAALKHEMVTADAYKAAVAVLVDVALNAAAQAGSRRSTASDA